MTNSTPITIRLARAADHAALGALAQLDSAPVPAVPVLVAETGGDLLAAVSLHDGASVADPFRRTADVLELLHVRAAGWVANDETARTAARGMRAPIAFRPRRVAPALADRH
jgi:hypothetical protein